MSAYKTEEEVRQQVIDKMGVDLGSLYHALWRELLWVNMKWGEYVVLFGTKPSRIELLNRAARRFFWIIQETLWEDTLLHIARLIDPPKSTGKENLTIRKLPVLISDEIYKEQLSKLIEVAVGKAFFCRDWRNRHIAHRDLGLAMKTGAAPLMSASYAKVKEVLISFSDVLNSVSGHYMNQETMYEDRGEPGDAVSLLNILYDGIQADEERNERVNAGKYLDEDFLSRDI
jgi:hypothetical protein